MVFNDIYEIDFKLNDKVIEISPINISFVMSDSIYSIFPKCTLYFNDSDGLYQEYLLSVEGQKIELSFGYKDNFITNAYCIDSDQLKSTLSTGKVNGIIDIKLVHFYKLNQSRKVKSYNEMISKIIKKIIQGTYFDDKHIVINDSGSTDKYFQPNVYDFDFIENYLLPVAYSNNSKDTPFYCFIDNNNTFHFRNYIAMMNDNAKYELKYSDGNLANISPYSFTNISRFRTGAEYTYDKRHRKIFNLGDDNTINLEEDYITDYPSESYGDLPIIGDKENITGVLELLDDTETAGLKEINKGIKIQSMRNTFALERFLITLPLNPLLTAGVNVNITIYDSTSSDKTTASLNYSGEYLIERSFHTWNGQKNTADTKLVISRKTMKKLNSSAFNMKDKLLS